jgi:hypothetical protein
MVIFTAKFADRCTAYLEIVYQLLSSYLTAPDRQSKCNVLFRPVRVRVFVMQYILHIVYCVSEALVIQLAKRTYRVIICGVYCYIIYSTLSDTLHAFQKILIK